MTNSEIDEAIRLYREYKTRMKPHEAVYRVAERFGYSAEYLFNEMRRRKQEQYGSTELSNRSPSPDQ